MQTYSTFSVAPMMDWTDRHYRYLMRLIAPDVLLYTEMVTAAAIEYGDCDKHLAFDASEHPVALQLGGSDPKQLALASQIGESYGYDEINLNVGCPSDRVQAGRFGVCLMQEPALVAQCVAAMQQATALPVTVKTRIGVDDQESYAFLYDFIKTVHAAGVNTFIMHARKAWLKGLSPKQNRDIPPLDYKRVYQLKRDFSQCNIGINGGIATLDDVNTHLKYVDSVMLGRRAYHDPMFIRAINAQLYPDTQLLPLQAVLINYVIYMERQQARGVRLVNMTRHLHHLYQGQPGAKAWRRFLSENMHKSEAKAQWILNFIEKEN